MKKIHIKGFAYTGLSLALAASLAACKDSPSHTRTASSTDASVVTPPTIGPDGAPIVDAGARQLADSNVTVFLSGSARFAEGAELATALWTQIAGPSVSLQSPNSLNTNFISPQVESTIQLVFQLTVTDNQGHSGTDRVRVTVSPLANSLQLAGGSASESAGTFEFVLSTPQAPTAPLVLRYTTRDGSAIAGQDYLAASGEVTLAAGATRTNIPVTLLPDTAVEGNETLNLVVTTQVNGETVQATATLNVLDDDVTTAPTEPPTPDVILQAVLRQQNFIAMLSDTETDYGKESLMPQQNPILNRDRLPPTRLCDSGEYRINLEYGAIPERGQTIREEAEDCNDYGGEGSEITGRTNGYAQFTLTDVSENFYESSPQNVYFSFDYEVDWRYTISDASYAKFLRGRARFENYDFASESGFRHLEFDTYTKSENGSETIVVFDNAQIDMMLYGLNAASTQLAGSQFATRISEGLLIGQPLQITLLEDNEYYFGEGGIGPIVSINDERYLLPNEGSVRYRFSGEGLNNATVHATYTSRGFSMLIDRDGNSCVDAAADLLYFNDDSTNNGILVRNIAETTPCQAMPIESKTPSSGVEIIDTVDGDFSQTIAI